MDNGSPSMFGNIEETIARKDSKRVGEILAQIALSPRSNGRIKSLSSLESIRRDQLRDAGNESLIQTFARTLLSETTADTTEKKTKLINQQIVLKAEIIHRMSKYKEKIADSIDEQTVSLHKDLIQLKEQNDAILELIKRQSFQIDYLQKIVLAVRDGK